MTPSQDHSILCIALPVPMRQTFDYLANDTDASKIQKLIGCRVSVPFGRRNLIGIVIDIKTTTNFSLEKLKHINDIIDNYQLIPNELMLLLIWASNYYNHPIGDVIFAALPPAIRKDKSQPLDTFYQHTQEGKGLPATALKNSPKQQQIHQYLLTHNRLFKSQLKSLVISTAAIKSLIEKKLISYKEAPLSSLQVNNAILPDNILKEEPKRLHDEQVHTLRQIHTTQFKSYLLEGITGSGKTEVYLQAINKVLKEGKQALVLIPEIGLSPQTTGRFKQRFNVEIAELHSNVSNMQRVKNWQSAGNGTAKIIIGTRLAALCPANSLGIIIIDEEHDLSYKQQDGFRYSARDICIYRAKTNNIPIILGSATPSLESLHNAQQGKYVQLKLTKRAGGAIKPIIETQDIRESKLYGGVSHTSIDAIKKTLNNNQQALVFINARGFAAISLCHACGWVAECKTCDGNLTLHMHPYELHCHKCDSRYQVPKQCPNCQSKELHNSGFGTEQTEHQLKHMFPDTSVIRIDRDSTQRKHSFAEYIEQAKTGKPCILVGTQMLAKGHHLPNLGLVVILDTDRALFSADFRAAERMGQLITQVAGRAGRENRQGHVIIQTHNPDHPLLQNLITQGYSHYAQELLRERSACGLPPYTFMTIFRAESPNADKAKDLLQHIKETCLNNQTTLPQHQLLGPIPAPIERLKNNYRFQLQLTCTHRTYMQHVIKFVIAETENHPLAKQARWSVDVDAVDLG